MKMKKHVITGVVLFLDSGTVSLGFNNVYMIYTHLIDHIIVWLVQ